MSKITGLNAQVKAASLLQEARHVDVRQAPIVELRQPQIVDRAAAVVTLIAEKKALEAQVDEAKAHLRAKLDGVVARAGRAGETPTSIDIPSESGTLRVTYADAYKTIKLEAAPALTEIVGKEQFAKFFALKKSLKIKASVIKDDDDLASVVHELQKAIGRERFLELFDASLSVQPTSEFTAHRYRDLDRDQLKKLDDIGVEQTVAFSVVRE